MYDVIDRRDSDVMSPAGRQHIRPHSASGLKRAITRPCNAVWGRAVLRALPGTAAFHLTIHNFPPGLGPLSLSVRSIVTRPMTRIEARGSTWLRSPCTAIGAGVHRYIVQIIPIGALDHKRRLIGRSRYPHCKHGFYQTYSPGSTLAACSLSPCDGAESYIEHWAATNRANNYRQIYPQRTKLHYSKITRAFSYVRAVTAGAAGFQSLSEVNSFTRTIEDRGRSAARYDIGDATSHAEENPRIICTQNLDWMAATSKPYVKQAA